MDSPPVTPSSNNAKMLSILATPIQIYSFTEVPDRMVMESHCHSNTTSGFQFCMPLMNIRTADHNEAYLNRTEYHTVKHHSCRNCNILYTVKPNDVIRTVSEESKHVR
jgi:hypothetical protein